MPAFETYWSGLADGTLSDAAAIGITDAGGNYTATDVEGALAELPSQYALIASEFRIVNQFYVPAMPVASMSQVHPYQSFRGAPFPVHRNSTFDQAMIRVATAGSGATFRVGIYDSDFALVYDETSTIDVSTTGVKTLTLTTELELSPGLYWVGGSPQGTDDSAMRFYGANLNTAPISGQSVYSPISAFLSGGGFIAPSNTVSGAHPASLTSPVAPTSNGCASVALRYSGTF